MLIKKTAAEWMVAGVERRCGLWLCKCTLLLQSLIEGAYPDLQQVGVHFFFRRGRGIGIDVPGRSVDFLK